MGAKIILLVLAVLAMLVRPSAAAEGNPEQGRKEFAKCVMCHSPELGVHKTGPSLAGVFGRRAGTAPGFGRYSNAMKNADVTWNETNLDAFLNNPRGFIPGSRMTMRGLQAPRERQDVIAYLKTLGGQGAPPSEAGATTAMPRGMRAPEMANLKELEPAHQVTAIRHCGDTYHVTVASGETAPFWEFNLRFKTDSSANGPRPGRPAYIPASMMGDRAFVVFASPREISAFIEERC
jgi:cytochrome c